MQFAAHFKQHIPLKECKNKQIPPVASSAKKARARQCDCQLGDNATITPLADLKNNISLPGW